MVNNIFIVLSIIFFIICFCVIVLCLYLLLIGLTSIKKDWYKRYLYNKFNCTGNETNIGYDNFIKLNKTIKKVIKIFLLINCVLLFILILLMNAI